MSVFHTAWLTVFWDHTSNGWARLNNTGHCFAPWKSPVESQQVVGILETWLSLNLLQNYMSTTCLPRQLLKQKTLNETTQSSRQQIGGKSQWVFYCDCFGLNTLAFLNCRLRFHALTCQHAANVPDWHSCIWSICLLYVLPFNLTPRNIITRLSATRQWNELVDWLFGKKTPVKSSNVWPKMKICCEHSPTLYFSFIK